MPAGTQETDLRASLLTGRAERSCRISRQKGRNPRSCRNVKPPPAPRTSRTIEELYLTGLRVEQINNPSVNPFDYYREALKRDPDDTRTNTILGINYNKRGMYEQAEEHLRRAIAGSPPNILDPRIPQAYYQLGLALRGTGQAR